MSNVITEPEFLNCAKEGFDLSSLWNYSQYSPYQEIEEHKENSLKFSDRDFSKEVVNVYGALLPKKESTEGTESEVSATKLICVTPVKEALYKMALAVAAGKPVLLQGPVGSGKTSLVEHLAALTGRKPFEDLLKVQLGDHMDSKMLLGTYCCTEIPGEFVWKPGVLVEAMTQGHWLLMEDIDSAPMDVVSHYETRSVFAHTQQASLLLEKVAVAISNQEPVLLVGETGILVDAMRNGYWIILDELNLAPSEVMEALNRVLDDNRELFIPETQTTVRAQPGFMVFATQNPAGTYGGRKLLSRAFRNRFIELHFNEIPPVELERILAERCQLPGSRAAKLVSVMHELQMRRRDSGVFAGKQGYITLRDLFRWGERCRDSPATVDWAKFYAEEGYMLLAGRVRQQEEEEVILEVLEKHFKQKVEPHELFYSKITSPTTQHILKDVLHAELPDELKNVVWTSSMRRLAALIGKAMQYKEPVLLVGNTGCGKTTLCQIFAHICGKKLYSVNCHMHSESADFLGGLRPVRGESEDKLFEWMDGPLVLAMQQGQFFLTDEISLADDSVLERLNSVLEPEQKILISEKCFSGNEKFEITAEKGFQLFATMNPGGDFGKKELSPALRNRFTEIWCPSNISNYDDVAAIVEQNIKEDAVHPKYVSKSYTGFGVGVAKFVSYFVETPFYTQRRMTLSMRDILTWVEFINMSPAGSEISAFIHGAFLLFIDNTNIEYVNENSWRRQYILEAKTPKTNLLRILRAMQLPKPILLEGSPGVGKTSLVSVLAEITGHRLVRINLSEQTDVSDLFGSDLPKEGGERGEFEWHDGPLLQAIVQGDWILLDELNLASQSVLEGLNACLDHRSELHIPELGKTFPIEKFSSRIFGCQNPYFQGGSRKGLPQSFLNRFTQVYMNPMELEDMTHIATTKYEAINFDVVSAMVEFNNSPKSSYNIGEYVKLIYTDRMRTIEDKNQVCEIFTNVIKRHGLDSDHALKNRQLQLNVLDKCVQLGYSLVPCKGRNRSTSKMLVAAHEQLPYLESLMKCIEMNWMAILIGPSGSGKSTLVRLLADLCGQELHIMSVNSEMDTIEILGGYEQSDLSRKIERLCESLEPLTQEAIWKGMSSADKNIRNLLKQLLTLIFHLTNVEHQSDVTHDRTKYCLNTLKRLKSLVEIIEHFEIQQGEVRAANF
ncbi:midasin-like [Uloborus diversus]|uniref:midasin-like n=1 Tax=Uloborus diversus TaxID=327109 RepID=UPI0024099244|nr:midasin-like [Uloborus diversus]